MPRSLLRCKDVRDTSPDISLLTFSDKRIPSSGMLHGVRWHFLPTFRDNIFAACSRVKLSDKKFSPFITCLILTELIPVAGQPEALVCGCSLVCRGQLKCDGARAETRFRLSAKRTSPFKSAGSSVQSTTGSRGVRISGSNDGYTMF